MAIEAAALMTIPYGVASPEPGPATDASLVAEVIAGSHEAIAILYDRYGAMVFRMAFRSCGDRLSAEEVVQETFLALWNRAEQFDPARGSLLNWLLAIARNRGIDHLRRAGRRLPAAPFSSFGSDDADGHPIDQWLETSGELIAAAPPEALPERALLDEETRASITAGLATLSPVERQVILLAYQEGLTQSEIATKLGWPLGTVKTRMRRAHRLLRDVLEERTSRFNDGS